MTTEQLLDDTLRREGGFVDRRGDRGGATKYGITAGVLGEWRGMARSATRSEVQALTEAEARQIYRVRYLVRPGFVAIQDDTLRALLVDIGVNSGPAMAIKLLQRAVGVTPVDGRLGPVTAAAANGYPQPRLLFVDVWRRRQQMYLDLALGDPAAAAFLHDHPDAQLHFLRGWLTRNAEFVA